jgi:hypothetical protein
MVVSESLYRVVRRCHGSGIRSVGSAISLGRWRWRLIRYWHSVDRRVKNDTRFKLLEIHIRLAGVDILSIPEPVSDLHDSTLVLKYVLAVW